MHDAATVSWEEGKKKPKTRQLHSLTGIGAMGGMFWGMLFGLIFFVPLLGAAIGAASGALAGSLSDVGIDDDFIKSARDKVTPGTSALFLMSRDGAVNDKVKEALRNVGSGGAHPVQPVDRAGSRAPGMLPSALGSGKESGYAWSGHPPRVARSHRRRFLDRTRPPDRSGR